MQATTVMRATRVPAGVFTHPVSVATLGQATTVFSLGVPLAVNTGTFTAVSARTRALDTNSMKMKPRTVATYHKTMMRKKQMTMMVNHS